MDRFTEIYAPIIGRILMGGFFLWDGIEKSLNFSSTVQLFISNGLPTSLFNPNSTLAVAAIAIAVEVLGGIALVVGYKTSPTALGLAIFTILTSPLYLNFSGEAAVSLFLQNMAVVGGLLYIGAFGSGPWDPAYPRKR